MSDKEAYGKRPASLRTIPCRDSKRHLDVLHLKLSMAAMSTPSTRTGQRNHVKSQESLRAFKGRKRAAGWEDHGRSSSSRLRSQGCGWERFRSWGKLRFYMQRTHPSRGFQAHQLGLNFASSTDAQRKKRYLFFVGFFSTELANRDGRHHELPLARSPDHAKPF